MELPAPQPVSEVLVEDVDAYRAAVSGVDIDGIRVGVGRGPDRVRIFRDDEISVTSCSIGFPMLSRAAIADDRVIGTFILAAPPGCRWCEVDLEPGSVLVYAPGAEHAATNRPGLRFAFVAADVGSILARAEQLGVSVDTPVHGGVMELSGQRRTVMLAERLSMMAEIRGGACPPAWLTEDLLSSMAVALATADRARRGSEGRRIDSRSIVSACIEFGRSIDRMPSISELCLASHVSERRLRDAFTSLFDLPPSRFFRAWALERARRRLSSAGPLGVESARGISVSATAHDLGFVHLGRFASYYQQVHGERPSETLRSA